MLPVRARDTLDGLSSGHGYPFRGRVGVEVSDGFGGDTGVYAEFVRTVEDAVVVVFDYDGDDGSGEGAADFE